MWSTGLRLSSTDSMTLQRQWPFSKPPTDHLCMKRVLMTSLQKKVQVAGTDPGCGGGGACEKCHIASINCHPGKTSWWQGPGWEHLRAGVGAPAEAGLQRAKMGVTAYTHQLPPCGRTWELLLNSLSPWVHRSEAKNPGSYQHGDRVGQWLLSSSNCYLIEMQAKCSQLF